MMNVDFTLILTGLLAALMLYMAVRDVQTYRIRNWIVAATALGGIAWWVAIGLPLWPDAAIRVGVALGVFVLLYVLFLIGVMGGGDVKLATALSLWFTWAGTIKFLVIMSLAGGVLSLIVLARHKISRNPEKAEVPYGVAIAFATLWLLTQRFLNHFAG
ncbi:prepilin peptidase [Sphingomicrobium sp. XHP0235]|uniref:A24 family peptidase n=1 Tax=Sphingomicrobium aquimarinum TaxID=3133971 RepID=UPI0031FE5445